MSTHSNELPRKQPPSVYTVMLILSTIFMLIAVIAICIEYGRWGPDYWGTRSAQPNVMVVDVDADHFA